ncbi:MAG: DUF427 domain-containing protein [Janthinobacterium lividum]
MQPPARPGPGQESVWDYPRPPRLEAARRRVRISAGSGADAVVLADVDPAAALAWRVLETSHPPTYYVARDALDARLLAPAQGSSWCEFKGRADYVDVLDADGHLLVAQAGWTYPRPTPDYAALAGAVAFYPGRVQCLLDDEAVCTQAGGFYGGWITADLIGPFKGEAGTLGW